MNLIVITGIDGAGKTSLQKALIEKLSFAAVPMHLPHSSFVHNALKVSGNNLPLADTWTDRLIFALDNRMVAYELAQQDDQWVVMQRGWMDSFIFGAVEGYNYRTIADLTQVEDLPQAVCTIYLNCDPAIAHKRIAQDPKGDKFETEDFMVEQHRATKQFYADLDRDPVLKRLFPEDRVYIDTSNLTKAQTLKKTLQFLNSKGIN